MLNKSEIWDWIKEIFSFFRSLYAFVLLLGIIASIIPQLIPVVVNPLVVEGAKYVTVVLISLLGSYFVFRRTQVMFSKTMEGMGKALDIDSKLGPLHKLIGQLKDFRDAETQRNRDRDKKLEDLSKKVESSFHEIDKKIIELKNFKIMQEEEHIFMKGKFSRLYGISCPICNKWIDLGLPNTLISGIHEVDGPTSESTFRGTKELKIKCPQCGRGFHIDIPHSEFFKLKS